MKPDIREWTHVFKLDPDKEITDAALEAICLSGTDAVLVGGSSGVTFDNTVDLLARIRRYEVPCVLELSDRDAVVPGFDLFFVPVVLNSGHPDWIVGHHHRALKDFGNLLDWDDIMTEGYIMLNGESTAARITEADTELSVKDMEAYARMADRLFRCPVFYMEYSGKFGDMDAVRTVRGTLKSARLFYGGGVDSADKARAAAEAADTVVVGNVIYEHLPEALATVEAVKRQKGIRL